MESGGEINCQTDVYLGESIQCIFDFYSNNHVTNLTIEYGDNTDPEFIQFSSFSSNFALLLSIIH